MFYPSEFPNGWIVLCSCVLLHKVDGPSVTRYPHRLSFWGHRSTAPVGLQRFRQACCRPAHQIDSIYVLYCWTRSLHVVPQSRDRLLQRMLLNMDSLVSLYDAFVHIIWPELYGRYALFTFTVILFVDFVVVRIAIQVNLVSGKCCLEST